uniref:Uncharacterized protein n=1 Tax=Utricularia reniformis TaxID=192314 RepID=A0A1Y0B2G7_9LAMI|nr:hypothetical protein AEK19_MT1392 [Utricularia reniformis]ART31588.1 hypothetical protein AEK19_MT1392 [Utricularia reniformis]
MFPIYINSGLEFFAPNNTSCQVHWSRVHDYPVPRESFTCNYSIPIRKIDHIGTAESTFHLMNALLVKYVFVYVL